MRLRRGVGGLAFAFLAACGVSAQTFEVATVKPTPADWKGGRFIRMQSADRFVAKNHALKTLIAAAYNVSPRAISGGPLWVESDHYDILAKTPGTERPTLDQQMAMLRELLAARFGLRFHRERKEMPIFALTVAKNGPRLNPAAPVGDAPEGPPPLVFVLHPHSAKLPGRSATMGELASVMQRAALDRPVLDMTGLSGRYDFTLEWTPDETQFGGNGPREGAESEKPGLFAAIQQQLGLKLEATKGPVDSLVIDAASRPSDN